MDELKKKEDKLRQLAKEKYHQQGELEFEDDALVSIGDDPTGGYVQAWVWVPWEEAQDAQEEDSEQEKVL